MPSERPPKIAPKAVRRRQLFVKGIATFSVVLGTALMLRDSEEKKVRELIERVVSAAQIEKEDPPFERMAKAKEAAGLFCPQSSFEVEYPDREEQRSVSREEIQRAVLSARTQLNRLEVLFENRKVSISGNHATITGHARALGSMPGAEGQFLEEHDIELSLERIENEWLICSGRARSTR